MRELREKCIKSTCEYNRDLNISKNLERRHFWDIQTSVRF